MIYRVDPRTDNRWDRFVENHHDAGIFHTTAWLKALYRTYGYEPGIYTTAAPRTDLSSAICFAQVRSRITGSRLVSLPFSDHCQPLVTQPGDLQELLAAVQGDIRNREFNYVEIKPLRPYEPSLLATTKFGTCHESVLHRLDLTRTRDEILSGFHKDCIRRKITRSEREGLRYEEGTSENLLRKFYHLLLLTRRRHQLPPQPLAWFRNLIESLGQRLKIRVASSKDGTSIASIVTLSFKKVVTYKYGCSDPRFNALGGMVFLLWRTIEDAMASGAIEVDFGRSDYDTPGLITFKDHWGATKQAMTYYRYPAPINNSSRKSFLFTAGKRLVTTIPDPLFASLGGLIYRHVG